MDRSWTVMGQKFGHSMSWSLERVCPRHDVPLYAILDGFHTVFNAKRTYHVRATRLVSPYLTLQHQRLSTQFIRPLEKYLLQSYYLDCPFASKFESKNSSCFRRCSFNASPSPIFTLQLLTSPFLSLLLKPKHQRTAFQELSSSFPCYSQLPFPNLGFRDPYLT